MKKFLSLFLILTLSTFASVANSTELSSANNVVTNKEIKIQLNKIKTKRIIIANALLLNDAQKNKANDIYSKIYEKEALLLAQLEKETTILKEMSKQKHRSAEYKKQRKIVFELQNAIRNIELGAEKEFKTILTHEQKVKFNRLRKEVNISDF